MLTFVVALHCEAKPIIDFYKLKKVDVKPFDLYSGASKGGVDIELVVTGIGALSAASAVAWLAGFGQNALSSQRVWLNVGTAGHAEHDIGQVMLVHGVGDEVQQRSHYPPQVAKWASVTESVLSVSVPTSNYPLGAAVDMEAYAFFNTAIRFSDSELVQSIKVVSDNEEMGVEHLNAKKLTEYVQMNIDAITAFAQSLVAIVAMQSKSLQFGLDAFDLNVLDNFNGTHSQRLQARELLSKISVLVNCSSNGQQTLSELNESFKCVSRLKDALPLLRNTLDSMTPSLA